MAQRGGSVVVHVKVGEGPLSPLVPEGSADLIASLEVYEALRSLKFADKNTIMVVNRRCIPPPLPGVELPGPEKVIESIRSTLRNVYVIECERLAEEAGSPLSANVVMLGALAALNLIGIPERAYIDAIAEVFRGRLVDVNVQAFKLGYQHIRGEAASRGGLRSGAT